MRNKTHKEILELVKAFIELLIDTEDYQILENKISKYNTEDMLHRAIDFPEWKAAHPYCYYNVFLKKQKPGESIQFENITFHIVNSFK